MQQLGDMDKAILGCRFKQWISMLMIGELPGNTPKDTQRAVHNRKSTNWLVCHYQDKVMSVEGRCCALTAELTPTSEEKTGSKFGKPL